MDDERIVYGMYGIHIYPEDAKDEVFKILDTIVFDATEKEGGAYVYNKKSEIEEIGVRFTLKNVSCR